MTESRAGRFSNRSLQFFDSVDRFERVPTSTHIHDAIASIERMEQDGQSFFDGNSTQVNRWKCGCKVLRQIINIDLNKRRSIEKQDLEKVLREFFAEFEHTTHRMYQMLYGAAEGEGNKAELERFCSFIELVFRLTTYAIVSYWIPEKSDETSIQIRMHFEDGNPPTVRTEKTRSYKPMSRPKDKKHRKGMERL